MNTRLQQRIDAWRARIAQAIAPPALLRDTLHVNGLIRVREIPFETEAEWRYWWLPERNLSGRIIRAARMSDREKERYTAAEAPNILVSGGITALMTYLGYGSGTVVSPSFFSQYFAVGNITLNQVQSNDTSVAGEYFRAVPSLASVSDVQQDLSTFFGSTQGNGSITNAGLFGVNATATIGSGTLMTHSQFTYTKVNGTPITADYLLSYA